MITPFFISNLYLVYIIGLFILLISFKGLRLMPFYFSHPFSSFYAHNFYLYFGIYFLFIAFGLVSFSPTRHSLPFLFFFALPFSIFVIHYALKFKYSFHFLFVLFISLLYYQSNWLNDGTRSNLLTDDLYQKLINSEDAFLVLDINMPEKIYFKSHKNTIVFDYSTDICSFIENSTISLKKFIWVSRYNDLSSLQDISCNFNVSSDDVYFVYDTNVESEISQQTLNNSNKIFIQSFSF